MIGMPTDILSERELLILSCFFPGLENKTSKQLEKCSGLSHEPVFRILKELVKKKYLKEKKIGKTNVYEFIFNYETYLVFVYFMIKKLNNFKAEHKKIFNVIEEFIKSIESRCVALFGSYSKGTEIPKSDIDLLVISSNKNILKIASTFKTKYASTIRPIVVRPKDFRSIKKDNPVFYKELIAYGIIFDGFDFFFKEVYK